MSIYSSRPSRFSAQKIFHSSQSFSSTSDYHTQSTQSIPPTVQIDDPQALLLRRWQDVLSSMATRRLSAACVSDLSRQLENAENLLAQNAQEHLTPPQRRPGVGILDSDSDTASVVPSDATSPSSAKVDAPEVAKADKYGVQISQAAHELLDRVTHAAKQLRQRQQDFKVSSKQDLSPHYGVPRLTSAQHLHDIAIAKTEEAAEKVSELALEIEELYDAIQHIDRGTNADFKRSEAEIIGDQAEITYLKFKMKMLEMQAIPYIPARELNALNDRIGRWKLNWEDIEIRFRAKRRRRV
ncbi:MAG: hypothetical protein Q9187_000681 [Circinaria calcarea]